MKDKKERKVNYSNRKKLMSATAMLLVSALMLVTTTVAWFTMSKEVEVTGINMTATVPETIEISLGLGQNSGVLTAKGTDNGVDMVQAPANSDESLDWSNTVAFYDYYLAPKLEPASSVNGANIWTTDDANGVGKTVNSVGTSTAGTEGTKTLVTTKHPANVTPNANAAADYIDFPVWIRTTQASDVSLSVKATVIKGTNGDAVQPGNGDTSMLYKAARVAVLKTANKTGNGVIIPYAGTTAQTTSKYYQDGKALDSAATLGTQGSGAAYGDVVAVNQTGDGDGTGADSIVTVPGKSPTITDNYAGNCTNSSSNYGNAVCVTVRVWLEGEDEDCWNATAGQDFQIALAFTKVTTTNTNTNTP
ncbi:MAG: hypothetical protein K6D02_01285 [Lachnospiraceae bacterium]|nr:hypothetical protein [Lachnospiraceae bacterium]